MPSAQVSTWPSPSSAALRSRRSFDARAAISPSGAWVVYVHETDRHFHQPDDLRFNHSRHFAKATAD